MFRRFAESLITNVMGKADNASSPYHDEDMSDYGLQAFYNEALTMDGFSKSAALTLVFETEGALKVRVWVDDDTDEIDPIPYFELEYYNPFERQWLPMAEILGEKIKYPLSSNKEDE